MAGKRDTSGLINSRQVGQPAYGRGEPSIIESDQPLGPNPVSDRSEYEWDPKLMRMVSSVLRRPPWTNDRLPDQRWGNWIARHAPWFSEEMARIPSRRHDQFRVLRDAEESDETIRYRIAQLHRRLAEEMRRIGGYPWQSPTGEILIAPPGERGGITTTDSVSKQRPRVCAKCGDGTRMLDLDDQGTLRCAFGCLVELEAEA